LPPRDILYVEALADKKDTLHLFVCHLPSQRGGAAESEWKRKIAKEVLQSAIDSVYEACPNAKIIVMGDFNGAPSNFPMKGEGKELRGINYQEPVNGKEIGTHKYQGRWTCLDHFYTSPSLDSLSRAEIYNAAWIQEPDEKYLDLKPKRTYNGFRYQKDGFSDHLPIVLTISL
jgi:endonuclease/exonuclease/phosphatase family metal-dependent hydrolase